MAGTVGGVLRVTVRLVLLLWAILTGPALAGDCARLFDGDPLVTLEIAMDPAEWGRLEHADPEPEDRGFHVARLDCDAGPTLIVGIRRGVPEGGDGGRGALEIAFDRLVPGQSLAGRASLTLVSGGVPEARVPGPGPTGFVQVVVNDQPAGLYVVLSNAAAGASRGPLRTEGRDSRSLKMAAAAEDGAHVVINEVLANTPGGDDIEYVELFNAGSAAQDLTDWYLLDDDDLHTPCPLAGSLGPGEYLIVPGFRERFLARYPTAGPLNPSAFDNVVVGQGFGLGNAEDQVRLFRTVDGAGELVDILTYGRQGADIAFGYRPQDADAAEYLSTPTPGASNLTSALHSPVCINEFMTTSLTGGVDDWIELHNRSDVDVDIGGWFLSDNASDPLRYAFPAGTILGPGGFHAVTEIILGFALSSTGTEVILLTAADGTTGQDYYDFGPQFADVSQGRFPDGSANWQFFVDPSPGESNDCSLGPSPPARVTGLTFPSPTVLGWNAVAAADAYDVVEGDLTALRDTLGDFSAAVSRCTANNRTQLTAAAPGTPGAAGQGTFYLTRAVHLACGFGTYDSGSDSQPAPRDPSIEAAGVACP